MSKKTVHLSTFFVLGALVFLLSMTLPVHQQEEKQEVQEVSVFDLSLEELLETEVYSVSGEPGNRMDEASSIYIIFLKLTFRHLCFFVAIFPLFLRAFVT